MFRRKTNILHAHSGSIGRVIALGMIFATTAMAFWWHFDRRMAEVLDAGMQDPARILTEDERAQLRTARKAVEDNHGTRLLLHLAKDSLNVPVTDAGTLFIGIGLAYKEAVVLFPPLVQRALGEGVRTRTEERLRKCISQSTAPAICLTRAIQDIDSAL